MAHTSYHLDLGNSSTGPVGFCAAVCAKTPEEALERFKEEIPNDEDLRGYDLGHITVYFNIDVITLDDVYEDHECDCDDYDGDESDDDESVDAD